MIRDQFIFWGVIQYSEITSYARGVFNTAFCNRIIFPCKAFDK